MAIQAEFGIPQTDTPEVAKLAIALYLSEAASAGTLESLSDKLQRFVDAYEVLSYLDNINNARAILKRIGKPE